MALVIRGTPIPVEATLQVPSSDWLEVHGLSAKKLTLDQLLRSLGFQQRTGTVPLLGRSVSSLYADGLFLQEPNSQGQVYNLCTATPAKLREVEGRLLEAVALLKARLEWLNSGSRLSFGVVYEKRVVMVIDSSATERPQLKNFLKVAISVVQEQLCHTDSFNIIWCGDSSSQLWEGLNKATSENLEEAAKWVELRQPRATPLNTSVVEAVGKALGHPAVESVHLLTHAEASMDAYDQLMEQSAQSAIPLNVVVFDGLSSFSLDKYKELAAASQGRCHAYTPPPAKKKRNPLHSSSSSSSLAGSGTPPPSPGYPGSAAAPGGPPCLPRGDVLEVWAELEQARDTLAEIQALECEVGVVEWAGSEADTVGSEKASSLKDEIARPMGEKVERQTMDLRRESTDDVAAAAANGIKKRTKKKTGFLSSKKWLEKNSLSALELTLLDALGPTAIPHSPQHVAILDKHVFSKVFSSVFPFAHVANDNRVTLVNPNGVDLKAYERKVEGQINIYWNRLSKLAWSVLPADQKEGISEECSLQHGETPSYKEHREIIRRAMETINWPRKKTDFDLLEDEISKGENYIRYSIALREEAANGRPDSSLRGTRSRVSSGRSFQDGGDSTILLSPSTTGGSLAALMDQLKQHTVTPSPLPAPSRQRGATKNSNFSRGARARQKSPSDLQSSLQGQRVIAQSNIDGFHYPGVVVGFTDSQHAVVRFADGKQEAILVKLVIPVGGAAPCPVLQAGDHVLVKVKTKSGPHPDKEGGACYFYIPGRVMVLPENSRKGHALHTVEAFNKQEVTSSRQGMIRISASRYTNTSNFIRSKLPPKTTRKDSGGDKQSTHSNADDQFSSQSDAGEQFHSGFSDPEFSASQVLSSRRRSSIHMPEMSHDRSRDHSEVDTHSQFSDDEVGSHTFSESTNQIHAILRDQQTQKILLEEQQQTISLLRQQQKELQESVAGTQSKQEWIAEYFNPQTTGKVVLHEQGVNTEMLEEEDIDGSSRMEMPENGMETRENAMGTSPKADSKTSHTETIETERSESATPEPLQQTPSSPHTSTPSPLHTSTPSPQRHSKGTTAAATREAVSWKDPVAIGDETDAPVGLDPLVGQRVLARWPDDGWYYRGEVVSAKGGMRYLVMDANGDTETIHAADIITDLLDSQRPLTLHDTVVALHPDYPYSYAPGTITSAAESAHSFTVEMYDGCQSVLPRVEVYRLPRAKHRSDVEAIKEREEEWVGQAVIARKEEDGLYYPGCVEELLPRSKQFLIRWPDGSSQPQEVFHLFGQLTKRRPLRVGDKVLALAQPETGVCMPGEITGAQSGLLLVEFCDGKVDGVQPVQCFWLSPEYHQSAVEYIALRATSLLSLTASSSSSSHTPSELTASYLT